MFNAERYASLALYTFQRIWDFSQDPSHNLTEASIRQMTLLFREAYEAGRKLENEECAKLLESISTSGVNWAPTYRNALADRASAIRQRTPNATQVSEKEGISK